MKEISYPIEFEIGDEVIIHNSFGDYDFGKVLGVAFFVSYRVVTEYGTEIHVKPDYLTKREKE